MGDRFAERMQDPEVIADTRLLGDFAVIYCRGVHEAVREPLESEAAELGVYGRKRPEVCAECAELLRYAEKRRAYCPKDPKPFCSYCDTHCYEPDKRGYMRDVMRYAGPRSWMHGHAVHGIKHLIEGRRHRERAEDETEG